MELDYLDKNKKYIDFTQNNIDLINFCISIDSSYRNAFNVNCKGSSAELIKNHWNFDKETIKNICLQIDKENSTHLAVSGYKKNNGLTKTKNNENNQGVELVVEKIMNIPNFENRLKDSDPQLVNIIANAVNGISKFSFASKFCSYVSRYKFDNHNAYSIYDKIISEILPYYEWIFLDRMDHVRKKHNRSKEIVSTVEEKFANKKIFDYKGYNDLIESIIKAINDKKKLKVDRTIFDKILWYYYKGDNQLRKDALNEIPLH